MAQRFDDVAGQVEDPAFQEPAPAQRAVVRCAHPDVELVPDPLFGPGVGGGAALPLEVVAGDVGGAGHVSGEAAVVDGVTDGVEARRGLGEQAEPGHAVVVPVMTDGARRQ